MKRLPVLLLAVAALLAALFAPSQAQEPPEAQVAPPLPSGVPVPPRGKAACYESEPPVCVLNAADFFLSERMARLALIRLQAQQAELEKLKESCVAKLIIPNDGTRKRS